MNKRIVLFPITERSLTMKIKCKFCNITHEADEWNKSTKRSCGEGITPIEEGINNNNWMYICPSCHNWCYKVDRERMDEIISNGTRVIVKNESGEFWFLGTIVGNNGEDSEDFGLYYYIVPVGKDRFENEMMLKREAFEVTE